MRHCQLGPERSVHKNVDNLTPFRINVVFMPGSSSRTRNPEFHFMENARTRFCHMAAMNRTYMTKILETYLALILGTRVLDSANYHERSLERRIRIV